MEWFRSKYATKLHCNILFYLRHVNVKCFIGYVVIILSHLENKTNGELIFCEGLKSEEFKVQESLSFFTEVEKCTFWFFLSPSHNCSSSYLLSQIFVILDNAVIIKYSDKKTKKRVLFFLILHPAWVRKHRRMSQVCFAMGCCSTLVISSLSAYPSLKKLLFTHWCRKPSHHNSSG